MLRSTTRPCRRMGNRADAEVDGGSCGSKHAAGTTIGNRPYGGGGEPHYIQAERAEGPQGQGRQEGEGGAWRWSSGSRT